MLRTLSDVNVHAHSHSLIHTYTYYTPSPLFTHTYTHERTKRGCEQLKLKASISCWNKKYHASCVHVLVRLRVLLHKLLKMWCSFFSSCSVDSFFYLYINCSSISSIKKPLKIWRKSWDSMSLMKPNWACKNILFALINEINDKQIVLSAHREKYGEIQCIPFIKNEFALKKSNYPSVCAR